MTKEQIEQLKLGVEQRCNEAYSAVNEATAEWHRTQGEYRSLDALLLNWPVDSIPEEDKSLISKSVKKKGSVSNG